MSTLKDVARLAGVSPSTVSRVINGGGSASAKTVEKIWQAVRETGYSVNESARDLRCRSAVEKAEKQAIDCVFARDIDAFIDPFFMELMHVIEPEVFKFDYRLRYQYALSDPEGPLPSDSQEKDAAIVLGRIDDTNLEKLKKRYRHLVSVSLQDRDLGIDSVICRGYDAAEKGLEYLLSLGHRRICYLGETKDEQRYEAYCDTMARHGCENITVDVSFTPSDSYRKLKAAMANGMDCTAIFCANDISAVGVLRVLKEARLSVPRDMSVIGINDVESVRYLDPMLTTVHIPIEEMGKHAARLITDRLERGHLLPAKVLLPSKLLIRSSCGKIKKR